jgi:histidyl-tRNA synthetase
MSKLQPIRGTRDLFDIEFRQQQQIINLMENIMLKYGYNPIAVPIFEKSEVFFRTLGGTSDIVTKETYTFLDRDKDSITLRPELTAGIMRALLSNNLTQSLPQKLYSFGPVFRHERPQKFRYRQFSQIDCEYFGGSSPITDVELINLAADILKALGLADHITLELNSLGDSESSANYNKKLLNFLQKYENDLSSDSKTRLHKNPLRILDSKDDGDRKILQNAPTLEECYNQESLDYWNEVKLGLDALGIKYKVNSKLVRGLDYYCHTVFEFITDLLGSQGAVLSGGRFNGLSELMGGPAIPSIGFAAGVERLAGLQQSLNIAPTALPVIFIIAIGNENEIAAMKLASVLRSQGLQINQDFSRNLGKSMRKANAANAKACLILGGNEISNGVVKVKDMATGVEESVSFDAVAEKLKEL